MINIESWLIKEFSPLQDSKILFLILNFKSILFNNKQNQIYSKNSSTIN